MANSRTTVFPLPVGADRTRLSLVLKATPKHFDCTALKIGKGKIDLYRSGSSDARTSGIPWTSGTACSRPRGGGPGGSVLFAFSNNRLSLRSLASGPRFCNARIVGLDFVPGGEDEDVAP